MCHVMKYIAFLVDYDWIHQNTSGYLPNTLWMITPRKRGDLLCEHRHCESES